MNMNYSLYHVIKISHSKKVTWKLLLACTRTNEISQMWVNTGNRNLELGSQN